MVLVNMCDNPLSLARSVVVHHILAERAQRCLVREIFKSLLKVKYAGCSIN